MFNKVLIANRGAIACRIIRTLRKLNIRSVAVYSEADRHSMHVAMADESVFIGESPAAQSYLSVDKVISAAKAVHADAIHPGYGFLSENADFAAACEAAGIVFIGPTPDQMRTFSLKHTARAMAAELKLPLLPGSEVLPDIQTAVQEAARIGYPVMLKSTAGGGGIGIRLCRNADELSAAYDAVARLGANNFGHSGAFLERFIERARHIEVQIFGDGVGKVVALGERDCSTQRRNQKVIEETPAPGITDAARHELCSAAIQIVSAVNYRSAGTVEFVYDNDTGEFYFLEVNTRLQVEHGVTEEATGLDLVEWMVLQASGDLGDLATKKITASGHAIEVRVYAEDPGKDFQPSSGRLTHARFADSCRVETWVEPGCEITPYYDPMIAKLIVHADSRTHAIEAMIDALDDTYLSGIETNVDYLGTICRSKEFRDGTVTTSFLHRLNFDRAVIDVLSGGTQTTVQDYPGRLGYWNVGVPPSGPMDTLSFRIANRIVGNPVSASALEITLSGPELKFARASTIALAGAPMETTLDGVPVPYLQRVVVPAGATLKIGRAQRPGMRSYLAVAGGLAVGSYLNSQSTFMLGKFGGHDGRALRAGDVIHIATNGTAGPSETPEVSQDFEPVPELIPDPTIANTAWRIGVLYGPHGAPDFFLEEDIEMLFQTDWIVHHHSDRTGVRLIGPKPKWARLDGGEAGLHPSNIHDNAYAVGTIDFTGDMPIILGPDGPSLGGFVCPATIVNSDLWKIGQLRPGDTVRFCALTYEQSQDRDVEIGRLIGSLAGEVPALPQHAAVLPTPAILTERPGNDDFVKLVCRSDGDRSLLVEFGPNILDIGLRLRAYLLESGLRALELPGIIDITPGIRSLQIHYDTSLLPRETLLKAISETESSIPTRPNVTLPSRVVHLPLSWNDPATSLAAEKYMQTVRRDAPWCPDNIEFIRRINGLDSVDEVTRTIFDASYFVLGLGDVYLGAPVATPLDPRHRLVTTKYNPARTWTPENAVGIGGAYMCIYGMEGPGGYQLFGRTMQVWNTFKSTKNFEAGTPWLLRFFDQIRFFPVSADELLDIRDRFPHGKYEIKTEDTTFNSEEYFGFLGSIQAETKIARTRQQSAFEEERKRWAALGQDIVIDQPGAADSTDSANDSVPEGCVAVESPMTSNVWKVLVDPGQSVRAGDGLIVLEAMKTETLVTSPVDGIVEEVRTRADVLVTQGQSLLIVRIGGAE